ncbi:hypothetical protein Tco_1307330 [Tanacetum coccineum]
MIRELDIIIPLGKDVTIFTYKVYYGVDLIFFFIGASSGVDDVEASLVWNMMGSLKRLDWVDFLAFASLWLNSLCINTRFWDCNAFFDCDDVAISERSVGRENLRIQNLSPI